MWHRYSASVVQRLKKLVASVFNLRVEGFEVVHRTFALSVLERKPFLGESSDLDSFLACSNMESRGRLCSLLAARSISGPRRPSQRTFSGGKAEFRRVPCSPLFLPCTEPSNCLFVASLEAHHKCRPPPQLEAVPRVLQRLVKLCHGKPVPMQHPIVSLEAWHRTLHFWQAEPVSFAEAMRTAEAAQEALRPAM